MAFKIYNYWPSLHASKYILLYHQDYHEAQECHFNWILEAIGCLDWFLPFKPHIYVNHLFWIIRTRKMHESISKHQYNHWDDQRIPKKDGLKKKTFKDTISSKPYKDHIPELPNHPDGNNDAYKCSQYIALVLTIIKRCHIKCCNGKKPHTNMQFSPKPHLEDIPDLTDHPDGITIFTVL